MKYATVNIGKSFGEVIERSKKGDLFEIYIIGEQGYTPKRYLCSIATREDKWSKIIIITPFDKFGRGIYGWNSPYTLRFDVRENLEKYLQSNEIKGCGYGYVFTLSKEKAYQHCMAVLRNKVSELRKKEIEIHKTIYGI